MSVVGIDLGAQSTKIGVARNKGIDIVRDHLSRPDMFCLLRFGLRLVQYVWDDG